MPISVGFGETAKMKKRMRKTITRQTQRVVLLAHEYLIADTPKDTTWASTNWIIGLGKPHDGVVGSKSDPSLGAAESSRSGVKGWDPFKGSAFLSNNVPYIGQLNEGSSSQAPPNFVEHAIARATDDARSR